eukprot:scaffold8649_cov185-Amphora_coffeaeformis.AAC.14
MLIVGGGRCCGHHGDGGGDVILWSCSGFDGKLYKCVEPPRMHAMKQRQEGRIFFQNPEEYPRNQKTMSSFGSIIPFDKTNDGWMAVVTPTHQPVP